MSAGGVKRLPDKIRVQANMTGSAMSQLKDVAERNYEMLQMVEKDNRMLRHTAAVKSVKLAEWIPFNSDKGLRRFFRVGFFKLKDMKCYWFRHEILLVPT